MTIRQLSLVCSKDFILCCFLLKLITAVVMKNWKEIVESCDLKNWREALAAVLTYAKPDEFSALCGKKPHMYLLHRWQGVLHN